MLLPKPLFLQTIEVRNVHLDVHSKEKRTGIVKQKYKLAGNRFPTGGFLFWVYTSQDETYPKNRTVIFNHPSDYEFCSSNALKKKPSYICIDRTDYATDDEIYTKYTNAANQFKKVAKVNDAAFKQLAALRGKLRLNSNPNSKQEIENIARATVGSDENVDDVLKSMGL